MIFSYNGYSQYRVFDYSLPNYTIVIEIEKYADSIYSGKATLNIYDTASKLVNTIFIDDYFYKITDKEQPLDCLVDFNNDGINDISIRTKFKDQFGKGEYEVYLFDTTAHLFVKNEVVTKFKNANGGKVITSNRTKGSVSVYDINNENFRQISLYTFSKNLILKIKTQTEDFESNRSYVIVTTQLFSENGSSTSRKKYLSKNYLVVE